ncbi:hypothetical protein LCI18_013963 [Fusarium solani-melongenae]|uniref:Uncharacterized protein n=1 Tax=Fusarium solani subsp. cucurbitae TaxID=2747967 RepID=A0ACD3ZNW7_FUSSC|nr:hypothetical protein LCI18_013963 [Fusarium solani-melongenae]
MLSSYRRVKLPTWKVFILASDPAPQKPNGSGFASHQVMLQECTTYDQLARRNSQANPEEEWDSFIGQARAPVDSWQEKRTSLCAYYKWFAESRAFCRNLAAGARKVPRWEEAVTKLNQIRLRRHRTVGQLAIVAGQPLIRSTHLIHLKQWVNQTPYHDPARPTSEPLPYRPVFHNDPTSHGLDEHGLLVSLDSPRCTLFPFPHPAAHNLDVTPAAVPKVKDVNSRKRKTLAENENDDELDGEEDNSGHAPIRHGLRQRARIDYGGTPAQVSSKTARKQTGSVRTKLPARSENVGIPEPLSPGPFDDQEIEPSSPTRPNQETHSPKNQATRPISDTMTPSFAHLCGEILDNIFLRATLEELKEKQERYQRLNKRRRSRDQVTCEQMIALLSHICLANIDSAKGPIEARFVTSDEARRLVDNGSTQAPIVFNGDQPFEWTSFRRPIELLFADDWIVDLDRKVSVQIPSLPSTGLSCQLKTLRQVRGRFLANEPTNDPWNLVDLANPLPPCVFPKFLSGPNCQLIQRVRERVLGCGSGGREEASTDDMHKWRCVTEWALMSQDGHHTGPHMDSHGLGTWITVQEGRIGFGYILPDEDFDWAAWKKDHAYHGDRGRYFTLKPGQTVYFPPGTIHFIFRTREHQTLAVGGHVLQWSGLLRWLHVLKQQEEDSDVTNEDVTPESGAFWRREILELVRERVEENAVEKIGGKEAADMIVDVLENWDDWKPQVAQFVSDESEH